MRTLLLTVTGPAGSGKTTLCDRMLEAFKPGMQRVITATTRAPREGEVNGVDYHFFTEEAFLEKVERGEFYEWARVHSGLYGSLRDEVDEKLTAGIDLLLNLDVQGAATYRREAARNPALASRLVSIFIMPASIGQIRERLLDRGKDAQDEIERRLVTAEKEMAESPHYHYCLTSASREEDFDRLRAIYLAEKMRITRD